MLSSILYTLNKILKKKILHMQIPNYLILNVFYEQNYLYKIEESIKTQFI